LAVFAQIRHDLSVDKRLADLQSALAEVREVVDGARFPLDLDGAQEARERAAALVSQLDDYLAPRLRQLDAPVLAVVGGSTGAGKSTLVNSLVRAPVSPAGVLRPTTRAPMLLAHPSDMPWFVRPDRLPGLPRAARVGSAQPVLQIVSAPLLRPGLALIDAPDFDSVVAANRALARELLAAADLWLFVTTAARYADAAPWQALRDARDRGVGVAIVVDRLPPESADQIIAHFGGMLAEQELARAPLFAIRESTLDGHGMVPEAEVAPVKQWLDGVAGSTNRRDELTRRTLLGALEATGPRLEALARAAEDQSAATAALAGTVRSSYATAMTDVQVRVRGGAVLRGDVYAAWRELVASGELRQAIDTAAGRRRARPQPERPTGLGRRFQGAVAAALAALVTEADLLAAQRCHRAWRGRPAGQAMLAADPTLGRPWAGFGDAAHDLAREVSPAEGVALLATVASVAPPMDDITGTGTHAVALREALREPGPRSVGDRMREEFLFRVGDLLAAEVARHVEPVLDDGVDSGLPFRLRAASGGLVLARTGLAEPSGRSLGTIDLSTMDKRGYAVTEPSAGPFGSPGVSVDPGVSVGPGPSVGPVGSRESVGASGDAA
jgi:hypothetical protein